jgi:hypothetical protein
MPEIFAVRRQVFNFQEEAKPADGKKTSHVACGAAGFFR